MASVTVSPFRTGHPAWRTPNTPSVTSSPVEVGPQAPGRGTVYTGVAGRGTAKKIAAQGGRAAVGASAYLISTRRVAQTGRAVVGVAAVSNPETAVGTGAFTHVTVTRDYDLADGAAPIGFVYFTPSAWLVNNKVTLVPAEVPAALDSTGRISISLAANDDPDTQPTGSHYQVREAIIGQPERIYKVVIPYNAGLSIDLSTLPVLA